MNILEALKDYPEVKIINLGSSCIYPLNTTNPIKESSVMDGKLETTNSPYAMAKLTAIEIGDTMTKQFGHKVVNLMPTNLYGPNDNFNPISSHVIPGMIYKFHQAKLIKEKKVVLWGDGTPLREFLYVDDLADAIHFILNKKISDNLINIGSSEEVSIRDLSMIVKEITGYEGEIEFDNTKPNGIMRKFLDSEIINSYGWKPKFDLETGLMETIKYFDKKKDLIENIPYML